VFLKPETGKSGTYTASKIHWFWNQRSLPPDSESQTPEIKLW